MDKADRAPFSAMLRLVAEQYGKQLSPDLIGLYFDALNHLSLAAVRAALNAHVRDPNLGQYMPKIADIVRLCAGNEEEAAYRALGKINATFSRCDDEIANRVIEEMGGFRALGQRDAAAWQSFGSKDFVKRYCLYAARARAEAQGVPKLLAERLKLKA